MECQSGENASDDDLNIDSEILATKHKLMSDEESDELDLDMGVNERDNVDNLFYEISIKHKCQPP